MIGSSQEHFVTEPVFLLNPNPVLILLFLVPSVKIWLNNSQFLDQNCIGKKFGGTVLIGIFARKNDIEIIANF